MADQRILKAAKILVEHSTKVKKGETVQIITDHLARPLAIEVLKLVLKRGAYPIIHTSLPGSAHTFYKHANKDQLQHVHESLMHEMKRTDVIIYISAPTNTRELSELDPKKLALRRKATERISRYRVENTRWVLFDYPCEALAQEASMSIEEFEDFVFSATNIDWSKEGKRQEKLKRILDKGKQVHIIGKNTDLRFSIEGRTAIKCFGKHNMPDGEVFIAPVETTTEGCIEYSFPAIYSGGEVDGITLEFKRGKVVKAHATKNNDLLQAMLNTDPGARRLGEFGVGTNYNIKRHIKQILFDEKIGGTIHLAVGSAYKEGGGKNKSGLHWDMILDLRQGGKIIVDNRVIQENGKFLI